MGRILERRIAGSGVLAARTGGLFHFQSFGTGLYQPPQYASLGEQAHHRWLRRRRPPGHAPPPGTLRRVRQAIPLRTPALERAKEIPAGSDADICCKTFVMSGRTRSKWHLWRRINQNSLGLRGGAVEIRISCVGGDRAADVESLSDWFRGEPELAGRLRVTGPMPGEGELGALADVLVIAVGSGGTLSVLATSLKAWLAQPRRSDVRIRVQRDGGETVEIDANRVDGERVDALIRQALGGRPSEE